MTKNLIITFLLIILAVTDAYLLSHPNLVGRIGVFIYKHDYIKTFPRALITVLLVIGACLLLCEVIRRATDPKTALSLFMLLIVLGMALFAYVYLTFSSFSYGLTGRGFIYGAHLLPIILIGLFVRYLALAFFEARKKPEL